MHVYSWLVGRIRASQSYAGPCVGASSSLRLAGLADLTASAVGNGEGRCGRRSPATISRLAWASTHAGARDRDLRMSDGMTTTEAHDEAEAWIISDGARRERRTVRGTLLDAVSSDQSLAVHTPPQVACLSSAHAPAIQGRTRPPRSRSASCSSPRASASRARRSLSGSVSFGCVVESMAIWATGAVD